jgi:hypothetical protein
MANSYRLGAELLVVVDVEAKQRPGGGPYPMA